MKTYKCYAKGETYYEEIPIEAEDEETASDKYAEMLALGEVLKISEDYDEIFVTEIITKT